LTLEDVPRPEPDSDELLVRVHAAGVNPLDWLICRGRVSALVDTALPWIPGWDLSGAVTSVGSDVTDFEPGDRVFGTVRLPGSGGAFAEYITVTAEEVTTKPESLSHIEAAGVPMVGQTAFHALSEEAGLESGQRVLVHAAAGGVGHMAVQFAANTGADVIGTASGGNEAFLRDLGVDEFVDYREERFEDVLTAVDVVIDGVGGAVLERSVDLVRPGGVVVTLPEQPSEKMVTECRAEHGIEVRFFDVIVDSEPSTLERVATHLEATGIGPEISETYPLAEVNEALDRSAEGHVRGKLVVDVSGGTDD
jgi:NADPH:quinone reductase-like Zn-dependent oxidoreductase